MPMVVLTDAQGRSLECVDRAEAHRGEGKLHRAFSTFVFQKDGMLLIQKRAPEKLFGDLWANTCCSHPREDEPVVEAGERRLQEELGFTCALCEAGSFVYHAEDPRGRGTEHEYDTVLVGEVDDVVIHADPGEIAAWKWVTTEALQRDLTEHPDWYAPWLEEALGIALEYHEN